MLCHPLDWRKNSTNRAQVEAESPASGLKMPAIIQYWMSAIRRQEVSVVGILEHSVCLFFPMKSYLTLPVVILHFL